MQQEEQQRRAEWKQKNRGALIVMRILMGLAFAVLAFAAFTFVLFIIDAISRV